MPIAEIQLPNGDIAEIQVPDGATENEILDFAKANLGGPSKPKVEDYQKAQQATGERIDKFSGGLIKTFVNPSLEIGGMIAGGAVGAASPIPGGSIIGGGIGYAQGKKAGELTETAFRKLTGDKVESRSVSKELAESGKDVGMGILFDVFGRGVTGGLAKTEQGIGWLMKTTGLTKKGVEAAARDIMVANTSKGPIYARNTAEAEALQDQISGLKFTSGQLTRDPNIIKKERALIRSKDEAAIMTEQQVIDNDAAIASYKQQKLGQGEGTIDDVVAELQSTHGKLATQEKLAKEALLERELKLGKESPEVTGQKVREEITKQKDFIKADIDEIYAEIPSDIQVDISGLVGKAKEISKLSGKFESDSNIPETIKMFFEKTQEDIPEYLQQYFTKTGQAQPKIVTFDDLRSLRTQAIIEQQALKSPERINAQKSRRLALFQNEIEDLINSVGNNPEFDPATKKAFSEASAKYRQYHDTYKKGDVANFLRQGGRGEKYKMSDANVVSKIWGSKDLQPLRSYLKATGNTQESRDIIKQYANYDLMQKAVDPKSGLINGKALERWLSNERGNGRLLDEIGIKKEYADLLTASQKVEEALANKAAFEKTQAFKMLGDVDPDKAIDLAFSGRGGRNTAQTAEQLMTLVRGNPAAANGLKKAFADNIFNKIQTTQKDVAGNYEVSNAYFQKMWKKYYPAMQRLYSGEELGAINNIKSAYEIMVRNKKSPFGAGSDTMELLSAAAGIGGPAISKRYMVVNAIRTIGRLTQTHQKNEVDKILLKSLFDPEYAKTIMYAGTNPKLAEKRFMQHIKDEFIDPKKLSGNIAKTNAVMANEGILKDDK